MKVFFAFMVVGLSVFHSLSAQDNPDNDVEWFEHFFSQKATATLDQSKADVNAKLQDAQEGMDDAAKVRAEIEIGLIILTHPVKQQESKYELALQHFIQAKAQADTLGLADEQTLIFLSMARVFETVGNHAKSISLLNQAQTIPRKQNDPLNLLVLNELGRVYANADSLEEAFTSYATLLTLARKTKLTKREADARFYLGILYTKKNQYDSAIANHELALKLRRKLNDKTGEALSLNEIGDLYKTLKNLDRARDNYVAALKVSQAIKNNAGIARAYNSVGTLYFDQKNFERAAANLELGLQKAQQDENLAQMEISTDYLSRAYKELKDFKKSLQFREQHQEIKLMVQGEKDERKLVEMENSSVLEGKEIAIDKLEAKRLLNEKQLAEERRTRYVVSGFAGLILVIAVLAFFMYRNKRKSNIILEAANARITQQNHELQQLNATKDKFFSIISHDLKGPLNSLSSFSGLLINYFDSLSKEEIQMLAKDLDKSLKNLFALLENLLEWSRSQTGAIEFTPEAFDLSELVQNNIDLLSAQAGTKEIKLVYDNPQPLTVLAHKNSVTTVIRNLISNAIKFTPKGGIITLTTGKNQEEALISIADTGVGMSKEVIDKIFRIDAKHSTKGTADEKGTGLGLVLCKDFVEKNKGSIGVHSVEGKGSTFYFTLPTS